MPIDQNLYQFQSFWIFKFVATVIFSFRKACNGIGYRSAHFWHRKCQLWYRTCTSVKWSKFIDYISDHLTETAWKDFDICYSAFQINKFFWGSAYRNVQSVCKATHILAPQPSLSVGYIICCDKPHCSFRQVRVKLYEDMIKTFLPTYRQNKRTIIRIYYFRPEISVRFEFGDCLKSIYFKKFDCFSKEPPKSN